MKCDFCETEMMDDDVGRIILEFPEFKQTLKTFCPKCFMMHFLIPMMETKDHDEKVLDIKSELSDFERKENEKHEKEKSILIDVPVKFDMKEKWDNQIEMNKDAYGTEIMMCTALSIRLLDDGGTCEETERIWDKRGITGFMAGMVSNLIYLYSERGNEFKSYWNKKFGGTGEEEEVKNPAILIIGDDEE